MDFSTPTPRPGINKVPRFAGFIDSNDRYISFAMADEVFDRAHAIGARVLLRLELDDDGHLTGSMYTNERGICPRRSASF